PRAHGGPGRQGLRVLPRGEAHELPRLPPDVPRALLGLLSLDDQPGHLHDPRGRGAVDDLGATHRGRHPDVRRRLRRVLSGPDRIADPDAATMQRMHAYHDETEELARAIFAYARGRIA